MTLYYLVRGLSRIDSFSFPTLLLGYDDSRETLLALVGLLGYRMTPVGASSMYIRTAVWGLIP
jgi:hypothetical protein